MIHLIVKVLIAGTVIGMAAKLLGNKGKDVVTLLFFVILTGSILAPQETQRTVNETFQALDSAAYKVMYVLNLQD